MKNVCLRVSVEWDCCAKHEVKNEFLSLVLDDCFVEVKFMSILNWSRVVPFVKVTVFFCSKKGGKRWSHQIWTTCESDLVQEAIDLSITQQSSSAVDDVNEHRAMPASVAKLSSYSRAPYLSDSVWKPDRTPTADFQLDLWTALAVPAASCRSRVFFLPFLLFIHFCLLHSFLVALFADLASVSTFFLSRVEFEQCPWLLVLDTVPPICKLIRVGRRHFATFGNDIWERWWIGLAVVVDSRWTVQRWSWLQTNRWVAKKGIQYRSLLVWFELTMLPCFACLLPTALTIPARTVLASISCATFVHVLRKMDFEDVPGFSPWVSHKKNTKGCSLKSGGIAFVWANIAQYVCVVCRTGPVSITSTSFEANLFSSFCQFTFLVGVHKSKWKISCHGLPNNCEVTWSALILFLLFLVEYFLKRTNFSLRWTSFLVCAAPLWRKKNVIVGWLAKKTTHTETLD